MTCAGMRFAYRERANTLGEPVRPVEVVKDGPSRSQKVRIRWLDGEYEGMEEWVPRVRLVVPWEQSEALLKDERRMFAALEASGDVYDTVPYKAVETVFFAIPSEPDEEIFFGIKAIERELLVVEDLSAASAKFGLSAEGLLAEPHSYVDRFGHYKAPFGVAIRVAKHLCESYAGEVLRHLKDEEDELRRLLISGDHAAAPAWSIANDAHRESAETRLRELEPVFALVRAWCGEDAVDQFDELLELRKEVDRLRGLVEETARWLRDAGHPLKAARLREQLDRPLEPQHH